MKNYITILILLIAITAFSQGGFDRKIYLDSLNRETSEGKHSFVQKIEGSDVNSSKIQTTTIYYLNNQKKSEEFYDNITKKPTKEFREFYYSGKLKSNTSYLENEFGIYTSFYENGNKETEGEYVQIKKGTKTETVLEVKSYWDKNNIQKVTEGNGFMEELKDFETSSGIVKNGFKDGNWIGKNSQYKITFNDLFDLGLLKSGQSTNENNVEYFYIEIEKQPEFKDGMQGFAKFTQKNYKVPEVNRNVNGRVISNFVISSEGNVEKVIIIKSLGTDFDKEAIRMINSSQGLWQAGEYRGIKIEVSYSLPIMINVKFN